jgi:elongator complex protein 1
MCLHELNFKANIVDISIFEGFTGSNMVELAVLDQLHLSIYDWDPKTKPVQSPRLVATQELSLIFKKASSGSAIAHQQVLCVGDGRFLILTSDINGSAVQLLYLKGTDLALGGSSSQKHLQRILARKSRSSVVPYLQTFGGMVIESDLENFSIETPSGLKSAIANFPKQTSKVELIEVELAPNTHGLQANGLCGYNTIAFGLSDHGSLYANGRCLAKDCTSFLVTSTHLIFTTTQNLLKFIHMTTVDGWMPLCLLELF